MATPSDVITSARVLTDHVGDDQAGTDIELTLWLAEEYPQLVRELARIIPDWYTIAVDIVPSAPGGGSSQFLQVRKVERLVGTSYQIVPPADLNSTSTPGAVSWRQVGGSVEILPINQTFTDTFRVYYISQEALPGPTDTLNLPLGLEGVLVRRLAARMCERLSLSTTVHDAEAKRIMDRAIQSLPPSATFPQVISDYSAEDSW